MPLDFAHDPILVVASFAIALMAGFTGLSLTRGASALDISTRKRRVAFAAIVLGGGIWSMHFVAMLGLQLPILFYYDALITLISALIAILVVGAALILLHFRKRTPTTITAAGVIVGTGILAMHYVGMAGIELCRATYSLAGLFLPVVISLGLSTLAIWVAYGARLSRNILLGTVCFACSVVALHFIAISGTTFVAEAAEPRTQIFLSNSSLAFVVTLAAFAICGGFLLSGATFFPSPVAAASIVQTTAPILEVPEAVAPQAPAPAAAAGKVPYERNGRTLFADPARIAAFRAEGHYTILYTESGKGLCPWSISEAERRMAGTAMLRVHRSYLVNPAHVTGFERRKDTGIVYFDGFAALGKVPVSRSRLAETRGVLGL